jgi:dihydroorotase
MRTAIINGHLIDPASALSAPRDLLIEDGRIIQIGNGLSGDETIDAAGCVVCPGLVDIQVHFREPGFESKETIRTGSRAAARGGITSVVTMANTNPPIDNAGMVEFVTRRARETACIKVYPAACATKNLDGRELTEMAELKEAGAVAVTDDGKDIPDSIILRRVLEYAHMVGLPFLSHCQDESLSRGGHMNEGFTSTTLGIPGIPKAAEEIRIDRNIRLAELTGAHIHIQHVSSAGGVEIVRRAKENGLPVTAETAPHYWMLTDEAVKTFDTNAKMYPPLREQEDTEGIIAGIKDGTLDCIATDHAPHTPAEKDVEFNDAPNGIIGLETSLALAITGLVQPGHITLERAIALMTTEAARICNLAAGRIEESGPADITIFDPEAIREIRADEFASRGRNSPFIGKTLKGIVRWTICGGNAVYRDMDS